jgi:nitroreductase
MNVSEAIAARFSARAFLDKPVPKDLVVSILDRAKQAPSGGNLQPWHVHVLMGEAQKKFLALVAERLKANPMGEGGEYDIYPANLWEPYRTRRFRCGEMLYESIQVPREDKPGRLRQFANNFRFFGAPVGLIFALDKGMGAPQWSDVGMYMQNVMLLAVEEGLDTCPQESWSTMPKTIKEVTGLSDDFIIFSGMAMGYLDEAHPINKWRTERAPLEEFATFHE